MNWMKNNIIANVDTDAISICKPDMSPWTKEEQDILLKALNEQFPELIKFDHDGIFSKFLVLKSKNYVMIDEKGKRKIKGSALKDQKASKKILQFKNEVIDAILNEQNDQIINIYHKYVKETANISDVKPWSKKLTITEKIFHCKGHEVMDKETKKEKGIRKNETSLYDAVKHKDGIQEGDKVWVYYNNNDGLTLAEEFDGQYDRDSFLKNLFTSMQIFKLVIDVSPYLNYTLKKNKKILEEIDKN